jgi:hypothetical protein
LYDNEITVSYDCKIYYIEKQFNMTDHYYQITCFVNNNCNYCDNKIITKQIGNSTFYNERIDKSCSGCRGNQSISVIPNDPNVMYGRYHTVERWTEKGINMPTKEEPVKDLIAKP